jgi:hypothetical protein
VRLSYYDALREGRAGTLCRLASAACTCAHELATYLTSRATYYVGYRPVQYRLARDLHMRHVQTQDGGGTKKNIHVLYIQRVPPTGTAVPIGVRVGNEPVISHSQEVLGAANI